MRRWSSEDTLAGEALDLFEVVDVVAGGGFEQVFEGHGAAFGVGGGFLLFSCGDGGEQLEVPVAGGGEGGERIGEGVGGVARKAKTSSQSARWTTISRMLHLPSAGAASIWSRESEAVRLCRRVGVVSRMGMGSSSPRYLA